MRLFIYHLWQLAASTCLYKTVFSTGQWEGNDREEGRKRNGKTKHQRANRPQLLRVTNDRKRPTEVETDSEIITRGADGYGIGTGTEKQ